MGPSKACKNPPWFFKINIQLALKGQNTPPQGNALG